MTKLADSFVEAGAYYGLLVDVNFAVRLNDGRQLTSVVRISGVSGDEGMLIFSDYAAIRADAAELVSMGFGYSVIDEPRSDERLDLVSFEEVFADWGWQASP